MNFNLVDLSNNVKTEFKGRFNDIMSRTISDVRTTNIEGEMLDIGKSNKNMDNREFADRLRFLQENKEIDFLGDLARDTGLTLDKIQGIVSAIVNVPMEFNKEKKDVMRESFQIGDKIEINASGNGPNNYAGMLSSHGVIKELKAKNAGLEKLLKEKDELITSLRETIELLKSAKNR